MEHVSYYLSCRRKSDVVFLLAAVGGSYQGWLTPFLGNLSRSNPFFVVTREQSTWIASLVSINRPIGIIFASTLLDTLGSKAITWITGISFAVACTIIILANSIEYIFVSLAFNGISMGIYSTIYPIYLAEVANPKIRGTLVSLVQQGQTIGVLMGNILGSRLSPWTFASVNVTLTFLFVVCFYFLPHSPQYLVSCKKMEEAERAMQWYHRDGDSAAELTKLTHFLETSPRLSYWKALRKLIAPENRKICLMITIICCFIQFGGLNPFFEYSEIIFIDSKLIILRPDTLVAIMAGVSIPASCVAMYTTDAFGRTTMLSLSCLLLFVSLAIFGFNFHLIELGLNGDNMQWFVIAASIIFQISVTVGVMPIGKLLKAELYAPNVKAVGTCVNNIGAAVCVFISTKNFVYLIDHFTYKYTFYMFAALFLLVCVYVKVFIPETKGKSLQEIQVMLRKTSKSDQSGLKINDPGYITERLLTNSM